MPIVSQRGIALVMSILFLLLLTLIGVTSVNTGILQERMAGNMRDLDIALQAAETSMRYGEDQVKPIARAACGLPVPPNCAAPDANGFWCPNAIQIDDPTWWSTWGVSLQQDPVKQVAEAWDDPRHVVEYLETELNPDLAVKQPPVFLRISARGIGSSAVTETILRGAIKEPCEGN